MKAARVEKQLYDVIALLLLRAIQDYNLYHLVVMDTISKLNGKYSEFQGSCAYRHIYIYMQKSPRLT